MIQSVTPTAAMWLVGGMVIAAGTALIVGLLTPMAAGIAALINMALEFTAVFKNSNPLCVRLGMMEAVAVTMALAIMGAGAYSVDAYLFGRREIIIPDIPGSSK